MRIDCDRPIRTAVAVLLLAILSRGSAAAQPGRPGFSPGLPGSLVDVRPDNGSRLWMDSTGKHTVEAVLASRSESNVSLQRIDGSKTSLAVNRLSIADQRFLQKPGEQAEAAANRSSIPSTIRPFLSVQMERLSSNSSGRGQSVAGSPSESTAWKSVGFSLGDDAEVLPLDRDGRLVLVTARASGPDADEASPYQSVVRVRTEQQTVRRRRDLGRPNDCSKSRRAERCRRWEE